MTALASIFVKTYFMRAFKAAPFGVWDMAHEDRYQSLFNENKGYSQMRFEDELRIVKDIVLLTNKQKQMAFDVRDPQQVATALNLHLNNAVLKVKEGSLNKLYELMPNVNFDVLNGQLAEYFVDEQKQVIILKYIIIDINVCILLNFYIYYFYFFYFSW